MKNTIKMVIPVSLVFCLIFSLCACTAPAYIQESAAPTATTTEATMNDTATTAAVTNATTTTSAEAETNEAVFTEDDALELVKNTYELDESYAYRPRGTFEVDGVSYYAIDIVKFVVDHYSYQGLTYFVTEDGSEILKGYIYSNEVFFTTGEEEYDFEVTEDNAVKLVNAAYDFEENSFLTYRGVEEIDGETYHVVDLRRSLETNTTYLGSYFITENGSRIIEGYYVGGVPTLVD